MAREAFDQQNAARKKDGLDSLSWDNNLYSAAQTRAKEIVTKFSHTRPNGTMCYTAVSGNYGALGENIAQGYSNASSVVNSWMNSSTHKANIMSDWYDSMAVACYKYNNSCYWVTIFGGSV